MQFMENLLISAKETKYLNDNIQALYQKLLKTQTYVIQTHKGSNMT